MIDWELYIPFIIVGSTIPLSIYVYISNKRKSGKTESKESQ